jgi:hypothetical protein
MPTTISLLGMPLTGVQVILPLGHMAEMLLKAGLIGRGESILHKPKTSVGLREALRNLGPAVHWENIENSSRAS